MSYFFVILTFIFTLTFEISKLINIDILTKVAVDKSFYLITMKR